MTDPAHQNRRRDQTRLLLTALLDTTPEARTATAQPTAGFAPVERVACKRCDEIGRVTGSNNYPCRRCANGEAKPHGCHKCPACGGKGKRWADPMDNRRILIGDEHSPVRSLTPQERDAEERKAARLVALAENKPDPTPERPTVEAASVAARACGATVTVTLLRAGSFAELERALAWLHGRYPRTHAAVWNRYVLGHQLDDAPQSRADRGLDLLTRRMPTVIRVPRWLVERAADARKLTVEEMAAAGWKTSRIARESGLTQWKVKQLLKPPGERAA